MRYSDELRAAGMHPSCVESEYVLNQEIKELQRRIDNMEKATLNIQFFSGSILMLLLTITVFGMFFIGTK